MPKLPVLSGKQLIHILEKTDYRAVRQRGSHVRMEHSERKSITVPLHRTIGRGLLRKIMRDAEITSAELIRLRGKK